MRRNVSLYLVDILQNMGDAEEFILGMDYEQFKADKKTLNAVLRSIEVMGESSKHIPNEIRTRYMSVPWKEMAGMRDKLIHDYFGIDAGFPVMGFAYSLNNDVAFSALFNPAYCGSYENPEEIL